MFFCCFRVKEKPLKTKAAWSWFFVRAAVQNLKSQRMCSGRDSYLKLTWNWFEIICTAVENISIKFHTGIAVDSKDILILAKHSFFCSRVCVSFNSLITLFVFYVSFNSLITLFVFLFIKSVNMSELYYIYQLPWDYYQVNYSEVSICNQMTESMKIPGGFLHWPRPIKHITRQLDNFCVASWGRDKSIVLLGTFGLNENDFFHESGLGKSIYHASFVREGYFFFIRKISICLFQPLFPAHFCKWYPLFNPLFMWACGAKSALGEIVCLKYFHGSHQVNLTRP